MSISDELANEFFLENRKMALHRTFTLSLGKAKGRWASTALTQVQVPEGYRAVADVETSSVSSGFPSQERYGVEGSPPRYPGTAVGQEGQGKGIPSSFGPNRGGGTPYFLPRQAAPSLRGASLRCPDTLQFQAPPWCLVDPRTPIPVSPGKWAIVGELR